MQVLGWLYVIAVVVLLFGASVFVHEFGHFWVARRCGLKVDGFSIGFGPKIFGWVRNGVQYAWRLIPAGGYVALPQMILSEKLEGKGEESLPPVSSWSKILVALAGPAMNGLFAFGLAALLYWVGLPLLVNPPIIGGVKPGSCEEKLGLRAGDRIVAVDGQAVNSWDDVQMTTAMAPTNTLAVTIQRNNSRRTYLLPATINEHLGLKLLDLEPAGRPLIEQVLPGSPAFHAGLQPGDEVVSFVGIPVVGERQLVNLIQERPGEACAIVVRRAGRLVKLSVTPRFTQSTGVGELGVSLVANTTRVYAVQKPGPLPWVLVAQVCQQTFATITALAHSGQTGVEVKDLAGPPGILAMLAVEVKTDYRLALKFMVLVNVSLALINLLPLPVLDGGHIALAMVEKLRGRPLSRRFKEYITGLFALLLICFMLYVSYNDIVQRFPLLKTMLQQKVKIETNPQKTTGSPLEK